jgi:GntR family transcriptional regulator
LYFQIEAELRERIQRLPANSPFPSDRELSEEFNVSRMTIRQAVSSLVREGLLKRQVGRGTLVAESIVGKSMNTLSSFSEDMRQRGMHPSSKVLRCEICHAEAETIEALQLSPHSQVIAIRRLRLANNVPVAIETVHLSALHFPDLQNEDLENHSLYEVLQRRYGVRLTVARGTLHAEPASDEEARLLGTGANAPLLVARRVAFNDRNEPIEEGESRYRGDRYYVPIELWRPEYSSK